MKFSRPRGTNDLFGERMERWHDVEGRIVRLVRGYGYSEIRTPVFEMTDLFIRAVGKATDIVSKEMYTFSDKKGRSLTLRPENTASVMRAFLENGLHRKGGISRFYYMGPMFRYDRPQAGRYRQFHQVGAEAIGSSNPAVDAEIIDISLSIYSVCGFPPLDVRLNSVGCPVCRPAFKEILIRSLAGYGDELCQNCRERGMVNPLRIFDCKKCGEVKKKLPFITDHLCRECGEHFSRLQEILDGLGIRYTLDPLLVRGLDYYTKTAFEIIHPGLGAQNALSGGGRYDGLAEDCGGGHIPAVGFSAGMERLLETLPESFPGETGDGRVDVCIILIGDSGSMQALSLAGRLRESGLSVLTDLSGRSMKKKLGAASEAGAGFAVFLGPDELEREKATVKNMMTGSQEVLAFDGIGPFIERERDNRGE